MVSAFAVWMGCFLVGVQPHGFRWRRLRSSDPERARRFFVSWVFWFCAFMVLGFMSDPLRLSDAVQNGMSVGMAILSVVSLFFVGEPPEPS